MIDNYNLKLKKNNVYLLKIVIKNELFLNAIV